MGIVDTITRRGYHLDWNSELGHGKANVPDAHVKRILNLTSVVYRGLRESFDSVHNDFDDHGFQISIFDGSVSIGRFMEIRGLKDSPFNLKLEDLIENAIADGALLLKKRDVIALRKLIVEGKKLNQKLILPSDTFFIPGPLIRNGEYDQFGRIPRMKINGSQCQNTSIMFFQGIEGVSGAEPHHSENQLGYRLSISNEPTVLYRPEITPAGYTDHVAIEDDRPVGVFDTLDGMHGAPEPTAARNAVVFDYQPI